MAYTARLLPPEEYSKLETVGIPLEALPNPATSLAAVVEEDGRIIGRWLAINVVMFEGLQIEESHRHVSGVARRLQETLIEALKARGIVAAITLITKPEVASLARHAGFIPLTGTLYQLDLRDKEQG